MTGSLEGHLGRYDDGIGHLHRSLELATEVGDKERIGSTWHNLVEAYVFAGRTEEAATLASQGVAHLQDLGLRRTYAALTAGQHALALVALGRWTEADTVGAAVLGGNVDPYFALPLNFARLQLMVRRGDDEHADRLLGDLAHSFGGNAYATAVCASWEAELALWRREWSRARAAVDRARTTVSATDEVMLELRLAGVAARVEADHFDWTRAGAGKPDRGAAVERTERAVRGAETLLTRVEEAVGGPSVPFHRSLAFARAEGARLSASPSADPWMALVDDHGGDPYFAAYARWRAAEALLAVDVRSSKNAATGLLQEAATAASALGAAPLGAEVAGLARRLPGSSSEVPRWRPKSPHRSTSSERAALTAREIEVLRLIGEGRSNREIGEALFISAKTASVHVTHILQKLNVATRVQAAIAADRLALG